MVLLKCRWYNDKQILNRMKSVRIVVVIRKYFLDFNTFIQYGRLLAVNNVLTFSFSIQCPISLLKFHNCIYLCDFFILLLFIRVRNDTLELSIIVNAPKLDVCRHDHRESFLFYIVPINLSQLSR